MQQGLIERAGGRIAAHINDRRIAAYLDCFLHFPDSQQNIQRGVESRRDGHAFLEGGLESLGPHGYVVSANVHKIKEKAPIGLCRGNAGRHQGASLDRDGCAGHARAGRIGNGPRNLSGDRYLRKGSTAKRGKT